MPIREYRRNGLRILLGAFTIGALIGALTTPKETP
jgi:hypothetical protein